MGIEETIDAVVRKAVAEEMRGALLTVQTEPSPLPPPNDVSAEAQLLYLALTGKLEVASGSLLASEFFSPLHRELWAACDGVQRAKLSVTIGTVSTAIASAGVVVTETVEDEIRDLFVPRHLEGTPSELRERVQEKARARRLVEWLGKLQMELRLGNATSGEVRLKMARWASRDARSAEDRPASAGATAPAR